MFYVYRFIDKDLNVIYVGRSVNINKRMAQHFRGESHLPVECYEAVCRVDFIELKTRNDMKIKELYYIGKYRPTFNRIENYDVSIEMNELKDIWVSFIQSPKHKEIFCKEGRKKGCYGYVEHLEVKFAIQKRELELTKGKLESLTEKVKAFVGKKRSQMKQIAS